MNNKDFHAFTTKYGGRANVLACKIKLSFPFDLKTNKKPHQLTECNAIWDTGATSSVVTKAMAKKLNLKPTGKTEVRNTSGKEVKNTYLINIYLPNKVGLSFLRVVECKELVGGFDFLIGMDVIGIGDFAITNVNNKTTLSYRVPSIETIDYVALAESQRVMRAKMSKISKEKIAREKGKKSSKENYRKKRKKERQRKKKSERNKQR